MGVKMNNLNGKNILLTGGTGSFGKAFAKKILESSEINKLIIYSRDELKQFEMANYLQSKNIRFFLGDVRDRDRLDFAAKDVDIIIHAAAMKQIPASEYNPMEAIKTNIIGAENIVSVAIRNQVENVIALSTDKAANPANLYGATKLCSDKLMIAGNTLAGSRNVKFSVVRYGNVLGSRGSVIPFFKSKIKDGFVPITDPRMTRFWLTLNQGVDFVIKCLNRMKGGEIFVPKIPSFKVTDVANVVCPGVPIKIIGIRPGEKLHEIMITEDDSYNTFEYNDYYAIYSPTRIVNYHPMENGIPVEPGFRYSSDTNSNWFTLETFRQILIDNEII
ncbi:MAG: hypothetical protein RLZZ44_1464 [Bacteroidota bacterium]|jgi:UDP-N-acetylglucosamine 4,6-dehydratase